MTLKKFLSVFVLTFFVKFGFSQVYQAMPQYGYGPVKRFDVDSTLTIPTVCGVPTLKSNLVRKSAIAFDTCNNRFYTYNSKTLTWSEVTGGGGGSTDTTSLSNRINTKIDSLKRSTDSVFAKINGTWYFQYKDSIGAGSDTASVVKALVHNAEATTLTKGTVVYLYGATGNVASVKRAYNLSDSFSSKTFAVVRNDIPVGGTGIVITQGVVDKLNLGAYNEGDMVYLDSIPGQFTKVKPLAPYHNVFIGIVERANNGNGQLYVKIQNGYELGELHNVSVNSQADNDVLYYQSSTKLWKGKSPYQLVDTTKLSDRIDQRVKYSDTSNMLTNYAKNSFAVKYSDTASMLTNYQKSSFAVKYSDTASMLSTYQRSISSFGYALNVGCLNSSFAANTQYWWGPLSITNTTAGGTFRRIYIPYSGTIKAAYLYARCGNTTSNQNWTISIVVNNSGTTTLATVGNTLQDKVFSNTGLNISVSQGDYIELNTTTPAWTSTAGTTYMSGTIYIQ
jgi:hypothetical protein